MAYKEINIRNKGTLSNVEIINIARDFYKDCSFQLIIIGFTKNKDEYYTQKCSIENVLDTIKQIEKSGKITRIGFHKKILEEEITFNKSGLIELSFEDSNEWEPTELQNLIDKAFSSRPDFTRQVLILHGQNEEWKIIRDRINILKGYKANNYNDLKVHSENIFSNIKTTIDNSHAVIIVMSAEIPFEDKFIPRPNVLHEFGLCSGIALEKTMALFEERVYLASNYSGIVFEQFTEGNIEGKALEVSQFLQKII
jgi:hypothetical protein